MRHKCFPSMWTTPIRSLRNWFVTSRSKCPWMGRSSKIDANKLHWRPIHRRHKFCHWTQSLRNRGHYNYVASIAAFPILAALCRTLKMNKIIRLWIRYETGIVLPQTILCSRGAMCQSTENVNELANDDWPKIRTDHGHIWQQLCGASAQIVQDHLKRNFHHFQTHMLALSTRTYFVHNWTIRNAANHVQFVANQGGTVVTFSSNFDFVVLLPLLRFSIEF